MADEATMTVRVTDVQSLMAVAGAGHWTPESDPELTEVWKRLVEAADPSGQGGEERQETAPADPPEGGQWMVIAFMGRNELTGYVTETIIGGEPAFHIDLPAKVWGGNPLAWEEYLAKSLYSRRPVSVESVRAEWVSWRAAAERRRQQEAEWQRRQDERALPSGDGTWGGNEGHGDDREPF